MISFTEQLLADLKNLPDSLQLFINKIRLEQNLGIWGIGIAGQMVFNTAKKLGINVNFFVDGYKNNNEVQYLFNTPVISPMMVPANAFIIISADVKYGIHKVIEKKSGNQFCYIDPLLFAKYKDQRKEIIINELSESRTQIDFAYYRLQDEISKITFRNLLIHRTIHQLGLLWDVFEPNQYFGNDVIQLVDGCVVDCGAYKGDTLKSFISQIADKNYQYFAFEPKQDNYQELKIFVEDNRLRNVYLFPIGLWSNKSYLNFIKNDSNDALAWKLGDCIDETVSTIPVNSIDNVLHGIKTDFIKMDIEGAELKALKGANECIKRWKPKLAISAYHELNHLWNVPKQILELNPSYKLYYRHHSWNMADSVCYGI